MQLPFVGDSSVLFLCFILHIAHVVVIRLSVIACFVFFVFMSAKTVIKKSIENKTYCSIMNRTLDLGRED